MKYGTMNKKGWQERNGGDAQEGLASVPVARGVALYQRVYEASFVIQG
jgi:hypothetical protein